jgi:regulator of RNase E activity RraA
MNVQHNDLIHADRHGAVVIPKELTEELPKAIDLMIRKEKIILDACKRKDFDFEILKKAIQDSAQIR